MLFPTATFAIFFLIVLPLSWLLMPRGERWRPFIVAASFVFYSAWDWRFVFLLAVSIVWNQLFALAIHQRRDAQARKALLTVAVAGNVALLGYFKYYDFFVTSTNNLFAFVGIDVPLEARSIVLPVGISFFTFMGISYVVDVYRRDFEPTSLSKFAAYLSFFPHLVAGPIVRPGELIPQLETPRDPRYVDTARAFFLIGTGLFMKVVIANHLASNIVDQVFGAPDQHSSLEVLVGVYAYAVQIYADFFGYTNIAIGIALLLGFRFPQNFDSPYAAVSIQDFWRRWHMTLSALAARLPVHPARRQPRRAARDLPEPDADDAHRRPLARRRLDVRRLGRDPRVGARRGALVARAAGLRRAPSTPLRRAWHRFVTFQVVCFAWIFFRSSSFDDAWSVIARLFTAWGEPSPLVTVGVIAAIVVGIGSQYLPSRIPLGIMAWFSRLPIPAQAAVLSIALLVTHAMGPEGVAPFIYFQF